MVVWLKDLEKVEEEILETLQTSDGAVEQIIEESLIEKLNSSRSTAKRIGKTLNEVTKAMKEMVKTTALYKPIA